MAITIMPQDPEGARQALEQQQQREVAKAEAAAQRELDVQEAIAKGDVVQMATLWLERKGNLVGDRCDESVRDMNLLTPELAHAADNDGLPYDWMSLVRTLTGSRDLFTAAPMVRLLSGAALQIENVRFAVEGKQRAANGGARVGGTGSALHDSPSRAEPGAGAQPEPLAASDSHQESLQDHDEQPMTGTPNDAQDSARAFLTLAIETLQSARNIVSFLQYPKAHADWPKIAPRRTLELVNELAESRKAREAARRSLMGAKRAIRSLEGELKRTKGMLLGGPQVFGNGRPSMSRQERLEHAKLSLKELSDRAESASARHLLLEAAASDKDLVESEQRAIADWKGPKEAAFRKLHREYQQGFSVHENSIAGLPEQHRRAFREWTGSSVSEVVKKVSDGVIALLDSPATPTTIGDLWFCGDELQDALRIELATLVRLTPSTATPGGAGDPTPTVHPAVGAPLSARTKVPRPKPEAIDATARRCLSDALQAAKDAAEAYVPDRKAVATAVSKALNYAIKVESLFGTKNAGARRVVRYPQFMQLWRRVQKEVEDAKQQHRGAE